MTVVRSVADLQMAERVEMGPDLRGPGDDLCDPVDLVFTDSAHVRVVRGRDQRLVERAPREDRNTLVENAPEVVQTAFANRRERRQTLGVVDVVEHAELVGGTPR